MENKIYLATLQKQEEILNAIKSDGGGGVDYGLYAIHFLYGNENILEWIFKSPYIGGVLYEISSVESEEDFIKSDFTTLKDMTAIANSSTAMSAVINSSTAMSAIANSSTAMSAIANSSTAMSAVANSSTAMSAVANSSTAMSAVTNSRFTSTLTNSGQNNGDFYILGAQNTYVLDASTPDGANRMLNSKVSEQYDSKYGQLYNCLKLTKQRYSMLDPWSTSDGYRVYVLDASKIG